MARRKVKTYFAPVCLAGKGKQSSPFLGEKTTKNLCGWRGFFVGVHPVEGEACFAFHRKIVRPKVGFHFWTFHNSGANHAHDNVFSSSPAGRALLAPPGVFVAGGLDQGGARVIKTSKSENLLLAGLFSRKRQAEPSFFGRKNNEIPVRPGKVFRWSSPGRRQALPAFYRKYSRPKVGFYFWTNTMIHLTEIESRARKYADAREKLTEIVADLGAGIEALKRPALPEIKRAVARAAEHYDALKTLIEEAPELFVKPKSITVSGIKLGYQKSKGKIEWGDAEQVVRLIKKHFPEQADVLIKTEERPVKEALNGLTAAELKRLGINVTEGGEVVFVRAVDGEVDKLVAALLKEATEEVA